MLRRFVAFSLTAVLAMTLFQVPVFERPAVAAEPAKPVCPAEGRPDRMAANVAARLCGGRVEVTGELSETTRVWAEPDGSFSADRALGVARFQRDSKWVDVDLTLERKPDGTVAPKAHPNGLTLSGAAAGATALASVGQGKDRIGLGWATGLPEPVLEGVKATYPEVRPGVDLVVQVTRTGFEQLLVVKRADAVAAALALKSALSLSGPQVERDVDGGLVFKNTAGVVIGRTPVPVMWDAAKDPLTKDPVHVKQIDVQLGAQPRSVGAARAVTLLPDVAWLADPARQFPITIDPYVVPVGVGFDTYVQSNVTWATYGESELRIGSQNSGSTIARSFVNVSAQGLHKSKINWATLKLWQTGGSCSSANWEVWRVSSNADENTRWSSQPVWYENMGSSAQSVCGNWVEIDATRLYQFAADSGWWEFTAGLRAQWEDSNGYYKTFKSTESGTVPHVSLNWNEPPQVTSMATSPSTAACSADPASAWVATKRPRLSASVWDSDNASSNLEFEWTTYGGDRIGGSTVNGVPSNSSGPVDVPEGAFSDGGSYAWRGRAIDPSGNPVGDWSQWCSFKVDATKPGAPLVSSKDGKYPKTSMDNTWGHGGYGQAGVFTLAPAGGTGDLASFIYQLDNQPTPTTMTATAALDVTIVPSEDGVRTLTVWAKDKAGNQSDAATYVFNVGRAGLSQPLPGANVVKRTKLAIDGDNTYTRVRLQYRRGPGAVEQDIPLGNLTAAAGGAIAGTTGTPVMTSSLGGNAVWNAVDTLGDVGGVAQVRARMYNDTGFSADLTIRNPISGRCLTPNGWGTGNGTQIILYDCVGAWHQRFELGPDGMIREQVSGRCLSPYQWGTANNTPINLFDCIGAANQKFERLADGQIREKVSGRCLAPNMWGTGNGTQINLYDCIAAGYQIFSEIETAYNTQWITINVDPNGDGAASTSVGPGSVNLLTGDHTLSATDIDEFGMSVSRTASSREQGDGWLPQGERLTANQQQVSTDGTGFVGANVSLARVTDKGQGGSADSLQLTQSGSQPDGDTYVALGGDNGGMRLGMQPGKRYRAHGWIYVPSSTGLNPTSARGLRVASLVMDSTGNYVTTLSPKASFVDGWQQLTVDFDVPAGATEAFVRLYHGFPTTQAGKPVYWDNLSVRELVAPFGPQWRGGAADALTASDYTTLDFPSADLAAVNLAAGGKVTFAKSASGSFFPQPGAETLSLTAPDSATYRLSELDGTVVEFTKPAGASSYTVTATWTTQSNSTSRYVYDTTDNRMLLKKVISPAEPGVGECNAAAPAAGCEVLEYVYTGDRVSAVKIRSWNPAASAVQEATVAQYTYDSNGRLTTVTDPRATLGTTYEYDGAGRVTKVTPAGQLPWMFDYGTLGSDSNGGWLHRVRRASLLQGSKDQTGPQNVTRIVYHVATTRAAGGPHDVNTASISTWGQIDLPTDATAIFGPEDDPLTVDATASVPGKDGYQFATVHYLNANGQQVNTATPAAAGMAGGNIDSQQYDRYGNVVWQLEATNRLIALGTHPQSGEILAKLGLSTLDTKSRANELATASVYTVDGKDLLSKTGPTVSAVLETAHGGFTAGTAVPGRQRTNYTYDEGKPDGTEYHLVTKEETGLLVAGTVGLADARNTVTGYAPINGSHSGWILHKATQVTADAGPGGTNLSAYTVYDSTGKVLKSWGVGASSSKGAKQTIYYSAGTNADDAACGNHPQWAGQPCVSLTVGENLPVRRVQSYNRYGDAAVVSESNAGKTRTTTTTFDNAGRVSEVEITSNDATTAVAKTLTVYDATSGQAVQTSAGGASTSREYDLLGRVVSYTDADGGVTRSEFDRYGRPARTVDPTGTVTYGYDRAVEPRGMLTSLTDSNVGTFTAGYSPDGQLTTVKYPGGITRVDTLDANLQPQARSYTRDSDGFLYYSESVEENAHGQWAKHTYTGGSKAFSYDRLGRLTKAVHDYNSQCTVRSYEFAGVEGDRTNRTAKKTWLPNEGGGCDETGEADQIVGYTYDTADRLLTDTSGNYTYDEFGRTTNLPNGLVNTFHANDLVASQGQGDNRQTWTLDPAMRLRAFTSETRVDGVWGNNPITRVNHYDGDTDSPKWITENAANGNWTRYVDSPDGDFAVSVTQAGVKTLNAANLHGDVAFTLDLDNPTATAFFDSDEYGNPTAGNAGRYGWLGGKQRSSEALGGVVLMGVRLYSPSLGRFLSMDPVDGGSCNAYDYVCADPVNEFDLDGKSLWSKIKKAAAVVAPIAAWAAIIPGPIGTAAALISAGAYAINGNYKQAALMAGTAALSMVGLGAAGLGIRAAVVGTRAAAFSGAIAKVGSGSKIITRTAGKWPHLLSPSKFGAKLFSSRVFGAKSRLFGDVYSGAAKPGLLNAGKRFAIGWSGQSLRTLPGLTGVTKSANASRTVFRMKLDGWHGSLWFGKWR